jgi:hypothetical protein
MVHDAVDHRPGHHLFSEHVAPAGEGRFEVRISEACSWRLETSWNNRFAASCTKGM